MTMEQNIADTARAERRPVWITVEQIGKLKKLTWARMYRVAKLVDKWNMRSLSTLSDVTKQMAQARRDVCQMELDMLESTWSELSAAFRSGDT